jgi:hypothetical protein
MKPVWKDFIRGFNLPVEFLHRDEFCARFDFRDITYPIAFLSENEQIIEFITTTELNAITTLEDLIELVILSLK